MSVQGIHDVFLAEGSINGDRFQFFIRNYLLPVMMPFNGINPLSVVIMDNASIHHVVSNVNLIESMGVKVIFLPPYSPDLNPLEPVFGKVKAILKENDSIFQATSAPRALLAMAFTMVTHEDCLNFSRHCGYY
jgi:transposase